MLFDTLKRKNKAEQEEQEWNANRPADYVSQNKEAMDALTGEIGSGYDGSELAKAYQQYRDQTADAAAAAADNTRANAAALSSGYGNSWADSLAAQGQGAATANVDAALTALRSRALNEYKNRQSGLVEALSGMGNTEALDRSAYGSNLSNWYNRQNFLSNQSAQARNENDNYWNNLWNGIRTVGNVAKSAYDGYMGYTQQQWENKMQTIQLAMQVQEAGNTDLAKAILDDEGIDSSVLDSYTGDKPTWKDQLQGLSTASGLMSDGDVAGAQSYLSILGMPVDSITSYDDRTSQAIDDYVKKQTFVRALSGSGSGSSSGSYSGGSGRNGYTSSNITTLLGKLAGLQEGTAAYNAIASELANAGVDIGTTTTYGPSMSLSDALQIAKQRDSLKADDPTRSWYQSLLDEGGYGDTTATKEVLDRVVGYAKKGYSASAISVKLKHEGYSADEIAKIFNRVGIKG